MVVHGAAKEREVRNAFLSYEVVAADDDDGAPKEVVVVQHGSSDEGMRFRAGQQDDEAVEAS